MRDAKARRALCAGVIMLAAAAGAPGGASALETGARPPAHFIFSSGFDLWHDGGSFYGAAQWSPGGIDKDGLTFKLLMAEGSYRYRSGGVVVRGRNTVASIMPGWKFRKDTAEITLYAGLDWQANRLSPDDLGNPARGSRAGLRLAADAWWETSPSWMVTGSASISSIGGTFWLRGATGLRVLETCWLGPEFIVAGTARFRQYRAGVHVTALKTGSVEWSVGVGHASDDDRRAGAYLRVGLSSRY